MPIITLEGPRISDLDARRALVTELTDAAAKAYGIPREKMIVILHENTSEQVAVGGTLLADRS
jgi:4-oxalocrotonate tautomerase